MAHDIRPERDNDGSEKIFLPRTAAADSLCLLTAEEAGRPQKQTAAIVTTSITMTANLCTKKRTTIALVFSFEYLAIVPDSIQEVVRSRIVCSESNVIMKPEDIFQASEHGVVVIAGV